MPISESATVLARAFESAPDASLFELIGHAIRIWSAENRLSDEYAAMRRAREVRRENLRAREINRSYVEQAAPKLRQQVRDQELFLRFRLCLGAYAAAAEEIDKLSDTLTVLSNGRGDPHRLRRIQDAAKQCKRRLLELDQAGRQTRRLFAEATDGNERVIAWASLQLDKGSHAEENTRERLRRVVDEFEKTCNEEGAVKAVLEIEEAI